MFFRLIKLFRQGIPCLFHLMTGLYCPGCGGTRAIKYLLHGNIGKSIQYHPLVFYTLMVILIETASLAAGQITNRPTSHFKRYEMWVYLGVAVVLINWGVKNYMLVAKGIDLLP